MPFIDSIFDDKSDSRFNNILTGLLHTVIGHIKDKK